nr:hypothetical protein [Tanacetum cinerariifolium]
MKALSMDQTKGLRRERQAKTQNQPQNVQSKVPEFEVADTDMPQDQGENPNNDNDDEPKKESAFKRDWFTKPTRPQEPTDPAGIYAKWGISYGRAQCKTFYAYAQGLECTHHVYSTKRILSVTRVDVIKKHGYGYLREIEVRRADNVLVTFKEGDFPQLRINDIKDMLILVAQNWLTNLLGNGVANFVIALKMFTKSLVI